MLGFSGGKRRRGRGVCCGDPDGTPAAAPESITQEIRGILGHCYERAREILRTNIHVLHRVAKTLLEKEVVDGAEIKKIIEEQAVPPGQEPPEAEAGSPA